MMALEIGGVLNMSLDDYIAQSSVLKNTGGGSGSGSNYSLSTFKARRWYKYDVEDDQQEEEEENEDLNEPSAAQLDYDSLDVTKDMNLNLTNEEVMLQKGQLPDDKVGMRSSNSNSFDLRGKLCGQIPHITSQQWRLMRPNNLTQRPAGMPPLIPMNTPASKLQGQSRNHRRNRKRRGGWGYNQYSNYQGNGYRSANDYNIGGTNNYAQNYLRPQRVWACSDPFNQSNNLSNQSNKLSNQSNNLSNQSNNLSNQNKNLSNQNKNLSNQSNNQHGNNLYNQSNNQHGNNLYNQSNNQHGNNLFNQSNNQHGNNLFNQSNNQHGNYLSSRNISQVWNQPTNNNQINGLSSGMQSAHNMRIEIPSDDINLMGSTQRIAKRESFVKNLQQQPVDKECALNEIRSGTTDMKTLLGINQNFTREELPMIATKFLDFFRYGTVATVHKPIYDMQIQKQIHELQKKSLVYKCPGGEVVSSDGAGINCQITPQSSGVSLNYRFA